jgi:nitrogen regulatory protein PII
MKKVQAEVRKDRFEHVDSALKRIGVQGLTVAQEERASKGMWSYPLEKIPRVILTVVVDDQGASKVVDSIQETACTRSWGDGKIVVSEIEGAWDIGTGAPDQTGLELPSMNC